MELGLKMVVLMVAGGWSMVVKVIKGEVVDGGIGAVLKLF